MFKLCKSADVPDAPTITEIDCNERRAMLRWRRPDDHGDQIKQFLIQMHTEFEEVLIFLWKKNFA